MPALICCCSPGGGTTDTGNARITGVVHAPDGAPAAGAVVTACPAQYHSDINADSGATHSASVLYTITDASGCFRMDSIDNGDWSIEVNDNSSGSAVLFLMALGSDDDATVQLDTTLQPYCALAGDVGKVDDTTIVRYLVAYGLERRIPVPSNGTFRVGNLPAGTFHWRVVSNREQWDPIEMENVTLLPESTLTITIVDSLDKAEVDSMTIFLNTASSGADVSEDVYGFPVLIRFTSDKLDFTKARGDGENIRFVKRDGNSFPFEIEAWDSVQQTASVWVRPDTIFGNNDEQSFIMLYGNSVAVSEKNGDPVFAVENGFLGMYHFSGSLKNSVLNGYHGIDSGSIDTEAGIIGRARSFNGTSQFFSIAGLPDRERGTISCWFRPKGTINSSTGTTQGIWGKKNDNEHDYTLSLKGSDFYAGAGFPGRLITKLEDHDTGFYLSSTTAAFTAATWYHVAWVWGTGSDSLYVNGLPESSLQNSIGLTGAAIEEIGRCHYDSSNISGGGPRYYNGVLDEFRIDATCRSAAWVKLCYMNQRTDGSLVIIGKKE
jgi:hypothetical protein